MAGKLFGKDYASVYFQFPFSYLVLFSLLEKGFVVHLIDAVIDNQLRRLSKYRKELRGSRRFFSEISQVN